MEKTTRSKLMWRWSLVSASAIALFWTIWYLIAGQMPEVNSIKMAGEWAYPLPFSFPRWCDLLLGPIWAISMATLFTGEKTKTRNFVRGLAFGLIFGLACCLFIGQLAGLVIGLGGGIFLCLFIGLSGCLITGFAAGNYPELLTDVGIDLTFCLAACLTINLMVGLAFGLIVGMIFHIGFELLVGLGFAIKSSKPCFQHSFRWLTTK